MSFDLLKQNNNKLSLVVVFYQYLLSILNKFFNAQYINLPINAYSHDRKKGMKIETRLEFFRCSLRMDFLKTNLMHILRAGERVRRPIFKKSS